LLAVALALLAVVIAVAVNQRAARSELRERAEALTHGNAERGERLFVTQGCGGCHTLKGVPRAAGMVGPPLDGVGRRAVIAGMLENTPQNLAHWIRQPQSVVPGNAMPDLGLSRQDANDIAAYLYSES
jgi:cytochrome c2